MPATTQWELVEAAAKLLRPVLEELIRRAAQGSVMHNDDTGMRILELAREPGDKRTGTFTSGIVSIVGVWRIALYFTGPKHAGENLGEVLKQRARELPAPIQMCDALSRNTPKGIETLLANCLAHGRRQFIDIVASFPEECRYVLETLGGVYRNDALAREQGLSSQDRLLFHQEHSGPLMNQLHEWMEAQLAEHKTEPNSGLGKAISYLLNHWTKLTLFLRQAGAPIDNNIVERALKKAILNRKNALFYKTLNGAGVGDLFMSLIHTCELNGANPFDYLTHYCSHGRNCSAPVGVDAVELPRDPGAPDRHAPPRSTIDTCMAEKDRLRPGRIGSVEMPAKRPSRKAKTPKVFGQRRGPAKMFRAGVYARVSTNDQQTIPLQMRALRDYAAKRGWTVAVQVKEVGSGASQRATAREVAGGGAPPRDRCGVSVALGSLGPVGDGSVGHAAGTGTSRCRIRFAHRGTGSDHADGSGDGRLAGRVC